MAEEKKIEQILSRARELRREAAGLIKTSEHLMEQCEMLWRFRDGLLENNAQPAVIPTTAKRNGALAAFDDLATKRGTEPLPAIATWPLPAQFENLPDRRLWNERHQTPSSAQF
jgi:hypothetical protein